VLDTGIDATHPDLAGKVSSWAEFDSRGSPFSGSSPHDGHGHGTHVSGTIAGGNASGQWIGVAPEASLAVGKVLSDAGIGSDASILAGISRAIDQNVDAINLSLGEAVWDFLSLPTYTESIVNALLQGIPVIVSVGNDGTETSGVPGNDYFAFAVGATDSADRPAGFSGGRTHVIRTSEYIDDEYLPLVYSKPDVSAPGVAVLSAQSGGGYVAWNGMSMAAPHVSGAVALLLSGTQRDDPSRPVRDLT
jgi:subtilisin family serine protease